MTHLDLNETVGTWVARHPRTSRVFESLQIDYCCGGGKSLEEACWERQLDPKQVVTRLEQAVEGEQENGENWLNASLTALCDHIEQTHHAYLRQELPRLADLIEKVVDAHGEAHPELSEVRQVFLALRGELEPHMFKEEQVLFPAIRQMEQSAGASAFPFGSVTNPINVMEHEHDNAAKALARLRWLTGDYEVPADACNTYRAMLDGLHELELNMHQHVHKENNILFPRAVELEAAR